MSLYFPIRSYILYENEICCTHRKLTNVGLNVYITNVKFYIWYVNVYIGYGVSFLCVRSVNMK
jgi:hypothetical protein